MTYTLFQLLYDFITIMFFTPNKNRDSHQPDNSFSPLLWIEFSVLINPSQLIYLSEPTFEC